MWLFPLLDRVSALAARAYYRVVVHGGDVPETGPVLLVANHPNSLLDPALVASAARRPVRFLAKAPLFGHPVVGWLVRGSGAIPVHRAQDDPAAMGRNEETFRAAHEAIAGGSAVAIFPEGISHDLPGLAPLKTGAARIALGAARRAGRAFPLIPVGLSYRDKERFRSEALVLVGEPIRWDDLAGLDATPEVVQELTRRIAAGLDRQTRGLASWEDAPLVEWATAIYAAHFAVPTDPASRVSAEREAARLLSREREAGDGAWEALAREVRRHARILRSLGLTPSDLRALPDAATAVRWTGKQVAFLGAVGGIGAVGSVVFYPPYRLTGLLADRVTPTPDVRSTYRTVGGAALFLVWIAALALGVGVWQGWLAGAVTALLLPGAGWVTLVFRDHWRGTRDTARRFLLLRPREGLRRELEERQARIAAQLEAVRAREPRVGEPAGG